jgi:AcrR family transcriptional regulator
MARLALERYLPMFVEDTRRALALWSRAAPPAGVSRRELNKQRTERRLHEAALSLVEKRGLSAVTVEEIAEQAGVSPRTFFNYYSSKQEAVLGHDPLGLEHLAEAVSERPTEEAPLESLRAVLTARLGAVEMSPHEFLRRAVLARSEPQLKAVWLRVWAGQRPALTSVLAHRMGVDPERAAYPALVAAACVSLLQEALERWCADLGAGTLVATVNELFDSLAAGLPYQGPARPAGRA